LVGWREEEEEEPRSRRVPAGIGASVWRAALEDVVPRRCRERGS